MYELASKSSIQSLSKLASKYISKQTSKKMVAGGRLELPTNGL